MTKYSYNPKRHRVTKNFQKIYFKNRILKKGEILELTEVEQKYQPFCQLIEAGVLVAQETKVRRKVAKVSKPEVDTEASEVDRPKEDKKEIRRSRRARKVEDADNI